MPEYVFVDGLLAGNVSNWSEAATLGEVVTVRVVDVGQRASEAPEADYCVAHIATGAGPGELRFVAARGLWTGTPAPV
ncbi:hypothetical protein [Cellulomonas sp. NS3]|uniref:hypothetical protein n=1 Tax=Cellulomonas sp. NS3 TaxID=2973977 RepID=UPI00216325BB|nr:hypothetical protein [Cellulomonas sp. NS3]